MELKWGQINFKSCLIEDENYLLQVYRYIELNLVRVGMVKAAEEYKWSSYQINVLGKESEVCTSHPLYIRLGNYTAIRLVEYQQLFDIILLSEKLDEIRTTTHKGMAMGSNRFKLEIERLTGRRLTEGKKGRPKKLK